MIGWRCEDLCLNESLPCNVQLFEVMKDNDLDELMMENVVHLKLILCVMYHIGHLINASVQIIGNVEKFHPSEMHEKPDVIVVQLGEPYLTSEVFHDDFHHGRKPVQQLTERKYIFDVIFIR